MTGTIMALRFRLVLTPMGAAVLVLVLIILIQALIARNSYEIVISSAALLLMLVLGVTGLWKSIKLKSMDAAWKPPFPMTAQASFDQAEADTQQRTQITGLDGTLPLFFRLHYIIYGKFLPNGSINGSSVLVETSVPRGDTSSQLLLDFPMAGIFNGSGFCQLRDIFGFFSFVCGLSRQRTVNVRSSPCSGKKIHINAQSGAEDQRNKQSADEERYYMREYTPGDRLRDINWKSSDRIDTLITRISTDNQEKISRLEIYFRNYGNANDSLEALWLLDRAKARLAYFLRSLMEQNSSFIFDVRTASRNNWEIKDPDDLDRFLEELTGIAFQPTRHEVQAGFAADKPQKTGELYVFSTACDSGLPAFLLSCSQRPVSLFVTQPAIRKHKNDKQETETESEILHIGDFIQKGCIPSPGWYARSKIKPLGVHTGRTEVNYAGIKL